VALAITRGLFALLLLAAGTVAGRAAEPIARARILTPDPIVAGQQVELQVDVLVPNFFMSSPQYPIFDLPNAVVTLPDSRAQNLVETIDGEDFAGIRRSYVITPQVAGDFVLPPAAITFTYAAVPGQATKGSVTLPQLKFTVTGAPGGAAGPVAIAAKVTVTQTLDRAPASLKAGDTLVRTVTTVAEGMQAMMIPVPAFEAPEGVRVYPHDPVLTDQTTVGQGSVGGKRVDRVTYGFEKPGTYKLPAIEIGWYDPAARKNDTAEAPEITVTVAEAAAFGPAIAPPVPAADQPDATKIPRLRDIALAVAGIVVLALLAFLGARLWPKLAARRRVRRLEEEQSEAAFFKHFEQACRDGDAAKAYRALDAWSRRARVAPITAWLAVFGNEATRTEFERLQGAVFAAKPQACDTGGLAGGIAKARSAWLAGAKTDAHPAALPSLNP
jgi:hypothetical protein